jgi:hypothetical protein
MPDLQPGIHAVLRSLTALMADTSPAGDDEAFHPLNPPANVGISSGLKP